MPEPDCFIRYRMRCNVGKIPRIGIEEPMRGFRMVLFTTSRGNNFVGGTCAPPSALLVFCVWWIQNFSKCTPFRDAACKSTPLTNLTGDYYTGCKPLRHPRWRPHHTAPAATADCSSTRAPVSQWPTTTHWRQTNKRTDRQTNRWTSSLRKAPL